MNTPHPNQQGSDTHIEDAETTTSNLPNKGQAKPESARYIPILEDPNPYPGWDPWAHEPTEEERYMDELSERTRKADEEFRDISQRMQDNPELALLLFNQLEPHIENFREHSRLVDFAGCERHLVPLNWMTPSDIYEMGQVSPRIHLRQALNRLSSAINMNAMRLAEGQKPSKDALQCLYLTMASARWLHDILNGTKRRGGNNAPPQPKVTPPGPGRGGARPNSGRKKKPRTEDEEERQKS
jgi:hypothetical protein